MSTGLPYGSLLITSGDTYPGVPENPFEHIQQQTLRSTSLDEIQLYTLNHTLH